MGAVTGDRNSPGRPQDGTSADSWAARKSPVFTLQARSVWARSQRRGRPRRGMALTVAALEARILARSCERAHGACRESEHFDSTADAAEGVRPPSVALPWRFRGASVADVPRRTQLEPQNAVGIQPFKHERGRARPKMGISATTTTR
eukprot:gene16185-biopygen9739